jgi:hypothetical protein
MTPLRISSRLPQLILAAASVAALAVVGSHQTARADPPFSGTIFLDPDIITPSDPTAFQRITPAGRGNRVMYDRRTNSFNTVNAYVFNAQFSDGLATEIQVNPEFGSTELARAQADRFAPVIGQLPTALRADAQTVWIHKGTQAIGGGNRNLLIHTGQADLYAADGILEETFVHEASHTSLDETHAASPGWLAAQSADPDFISTYARDNPTREDVAESFLPYLAVRHRAGRITANLANTIRQTIPNRIDYFDDQSLDMFPIVAPYRVADANADGRVDVGDLGILATNFNESPADPAGRAGGDFDGDNSVNVSDLGILATHFNKHLAAAADGAAPMTFEEAMVLPQFAGLAAQVPEPWGPAAAGLTALAALAPSRRRGPR